MSDVELVIKIPEEVRVAITRMGLLRIPNEMQKKVDRAIQRGTPLPKGHGDLIDVNRKITVPIYDEQYEEWGEKILTVREALNRWSDEGITVKDVVISADKADKEGES